MKERREKNDHLHEGGGVASLRPRPETQSKPEQRSGLSCGSWSPVWSGGLPGVCYYLLL